MPVPPAKPRLLCTLCLPAVAGSAALVLALALFQGWEAAYSQDSDSKGRVAVVLTLTQEDNGKSLEVHPGDDIAVSLEENPGTGFQWAIAKGDEAILVLRDAAYLPDPGGKLGGNGRRVFTFQAQKTGTALLQLDLWRPWEGEKSVVERFSVTLRVLSLTR